ncbi:MAG: hypothetical protein NXI27_19690 [Alphaproteobacteria bacterium]|nr:hypothetical protein [Alphaproteobacteria bacterium]
MKLRFIHSLTRNTGPAVLGAIGLGFLCAVVVPAQAQTIVRDPMICGERAIASVFVDYSENWQAEEEREEDQDSSLTLSDGSIVSTEQIQRGGSSGDNFTRLTRFRPDGTVLSKKDFVDRTPFSASAPLPDGRFMALGENSVLVLTADGAIEHEDPRPGLEYWASIETILALSDGSQLLVGNQSHSERSDDSSAFAIKVTGSAGVLWRTEFNDGFLDYPVAALEQPDGTVVIIGNGWVRENGGLIDTAGIARLDTAGEILLLERLGHDIGDNFIAITPTPPEGSFMVSGTSRVTGKDGSTTNRFWLIRFHQDGRVIWDRTYLSPPVTVSTQEGYVRSVGDDQIEVVWFLMDMQMNDLQHQECTYLFDRNGNMIER